jgi:hypothetical protein
VFWRMKARRGETASRDIAISGSIQQQVVAELAINPNTVLKAYREIESVGAIFLALRGKAEGKFGQVSTHACRRG